MDFLKLLWIQIKLNCKDITFLSCILVGPILVILGVQLLADTPLASGRIAVVNEDQGLFATHMLEQLSLDRDLLLFSTYEEAMKANVDAVVVISEDFSSTLERGKKPQVRLYQKSIFPFPRLTQSIERFVENQGRKLLLENFGISPEEKSVKIQLAESHDLGFSRGGMPVTMTFTLAFSTTTRIASSLFQLKKQKVLMRLMTMKHKSSRLLISFCLGHYLTQILLMSTTFFLFHFVFHHDVGQIGHLFILMNLMAFFTVNLAICLVRLCSTPQILDGIMLLVTLPLMFAGMFHGNHQLIPLPTTIIALAQFSPFYWLFDVLFNGSLWPGAIILLLLNLVLLTAGSFKIEKFFEQ